MYWSISNLRPQTAPRPPPGAEKFPPGVGFGRRGHRAGTLSSSLLPFQQTRETGVYCTTVSVIFQEDYESK